MGLDRLWRLTILGSVMSGPVKHIPDASGRTQNKSKMGILNSKSLALDDDSATSSTETNPSTSASIASPTDTNTTVIDGNQRVWSTGPWSDCDIECGVGVQQRSVTCMDNDTMSVLPDSVCLSDQFVIPSIRPDTGQECQGVCVKCDNHDMLFRSIGLVSPPSKPVAAASGKVCSVSDPTYSCCDTAVENSIITQVVAIHKGFEKIPVTAQQQIDTTMSFIQNSTTDFLASQAETQTQLDSINTVLTRPGNLKTATDKWITRALTTMRDVLAQRIDDLTDAVANSSAVIQLLTQQLQALQTDVGRTTNITSGYNITQSVGRSPQLSDCVDATVQLFTSMSCAACNPSFIESEVANTTVAHANGVLVSNTMCQAVFKECSPTIRMSRNYLRQALAVMSGIHRKLAQISVRVQPAMLAMWGSITLDWVPGSEHPLSSYQSNEDAIVPDVTSLDCIRNVKQYILSSATQMTDFCDNYFGSWNYHFTIRGILADITTGVNAFSALTKCDACIHLIVSKITDVLANGGGGLDVTLALNKDALAEAGCAGLSSTPAARKSPETDTNSTVTLSNNLKNFFGLSAGELWGSAAQRVSMDKKSQRAFAIILAASKKSKSLLVRDSLTVEDQSALAIARPPLFVTQLNFSDAGVDPMTLANVSWDIINNAAVNPPPPIWDIRSSAEVGVTASDMNCTSHTACNPDSGDAPYWFCANSKVCNGTIPCDSTELSLLSVHARCVKGLCVDDRTAVDGKCPDVAVCPKTGSGQFDHTYFSKFKSIAPQMPPPAELVAASGPEQASALTQAATYATGVCDCAFGQKIDASGQSELYVANSCVYATCVAYAQMIESTASCTAGLANTCTQLQLACPNVTCDKALAQWTLPTCDSVSVNEAGFALSSETKAAGVYFGGIARWIVALLVVVNTW